MHIWKEYFDDYGVYINLFVLISVQVVTGVDGNFNILVIKIVRKILVFQRSTEPVIYQSVYFKQTWFNNFDFFAFDAEISRTLNTTYWLKTMAILIASKVKIELN